MAFAPHGDGEHGLRFSPAIGGTEDSITQLIQFNQTNKRRRLTNKKKSYDEIENDI